MGDEAVCVLERGDALWRAQRQSRHAVSVLRTLAWQADTDASAGG